MLIIFVFSLFVLILIHPDFATNASPASSENESRSEEVIQCKCVAYYHCHEVNKFMILSRTSVTPNETHCFNDDYTCCKIALTSATDDDSTDGLLTSSLVSFKSNCGMPKTKINPKNESATTIPGEIPWIVEIFKKNQNFPFRFKCAGSLIHPKVVLTTTRCVLSAKEKSLKIVAPGETTFESLGTRPESERNVLKIIKHPNYYSGALYNDIALLILENEYNFSNNFLNSVCLPPSNENFNGKRCLLVKWDKNSNQMKIPLLKVDVPIIESQRCQDFLRKTYLGSEFILDSSFLCAGGEEVKAACDGDDGSPLICLGSDHKFVQIGIASWGIGCGVLNQPGVFTNVAQFKDWIKEQLLKNKIEIN
jgi:hypothetical protein